MASRGTFKLEEQALEALENSTKMLKVASDLLEQGNQAEARRLLNKARMQRTISTLLMAKASRRATPKHSRSQRYPQTANLPIQSFR
jgi:hypothetical protein